MLDNLAQLLELRVISEEVEVAKTGTAGARSARTSATSCTAASTTGTRSCAAVASAGLSSGFKQIYGLVISRRVRGICGNGSRRRLLLLLLGRGASASRGGRCLLLVLIDALRNTLQRLVSTNHTDSNVEA
jgi:hypothetical protein